MRARSILILGLLVPLIAFAAPIPGPPGSTGTGEWTDTGNTIYPAETADEVSIGAVTPAGGAKLAVTGDTAAQVQLEVRGASGQTANRARFTDDGGGDATVIAADGSLTVSGNAVITGTANTGTLSVTGSSPSLLLNDSSPCVDPPSGANAICATVGNAFIRDTGGSTLQLAKVADILGKRTFVISASSMNLDSTAPPAPSGYVQPSGSTIPGFSALDFDPNTIEYAYFALPFPASYDGGSVECKPIWTANSTSTNTVRWDFAWVKSADGASVGNSIATSGIVDDANGSTAHTFRIGAYTSAGNGGSASAGELIGQFRVIRRANAAEDTLAVDARLISVQCRYTISALTDN